ncbi:MAG: hypothetical protein ACRC0V_08140 [Fusobacteriaceae bacterium]
MGMPPLNNAYLIAMLLFLAQAAKHYFYLSDYNLENREIVIMKDDILNAIVLNIVAILALVIQIGGYTIFFLSVFFSNR